jgi:hypothetical protein
MSFSTTTETPYRTEEQISIDKISAERERFDLDRWKKASPYELINQMVCIVADEQQVIRRNIDTLISLRKTFNGDDKNEALAEAADAQLLKFVNGLAGTTVAKNISEVLTKLESV